MANSGEIGNILSELKSMCPSGFAIAFHIRFTTPAFLFQTYPKEWLNIYNQKGMVMQDPIVGWSFANNGHTRWSDLADNDPAGVLTEGAKFGLNYGVAAGIEEGGSKSIAGFARPDREFTDQEIGSLVGMVTALHNITAEAKSVSPETREELRRMSITFTHP